MKRCCSQGKQLQPQLADHVVQNMYCTASRVGCSARCHQHHPRRRVAPEKAVQSIGFQHCSHYGRRHCTTVHPDVYCHMALRMHRAHPPLTGPPLVPCAATLQRRSLFAHSLAQPLKASRAGSCATQLTIVSNHGHPNFTAGGFLANGCHTARCHPDEHATGLPRAHVPLP